jgi:hypothetical protein
MSGFAILMVQDDGYIGPHDEAAEFARIRAIPSIVGPLPNSGEFGYGPSGALRPSVSPANAVVQQESAIAVRPFRPLCRLEARTTMPYE